MATLQEYYNGGYSVFGSVATDISWIAQTFTAASSYDIEYVNLYVNRIDTPNNVTVSIKATDASGHPTGADLASCVLDGNALNGAGTWVTFTFSSSYSLVSGTKYAIVLKIANTLSNQLGWGRYTGDVFAGGCYERTTDSGATWTTYTGYDYEFENWGSVNSDVNLSGSIGGSGGLTGTLSLTIKYLSGNILASSGLTGTLAQLQALSGSFTGQSNLSGLISVKVKELSGTVVGSSSLTGYLSNIKYLSGNLSFTSSLAGKLTAFYSGYWVVKRPSNYDKTKVYDEVVQDWITSDNRGGSRFRNQLIVMAQQDDGNAKIYYSGV